jgi:hypothetical protein
MKKIIILLFSFSLNTSLFASLCYYEKPLKATETYISIGNNIKISLLDFSTIKRKSFERIPGSNLNFIQRIAFKSIQNEIKKNIEPDGTIKNKKFIEFLEGGPAKGFHAGGFFLGLLLLAPGVLISYILGGDPSVKKNRRKWTWIGFGVGFLVFITFYILLETKVISLFW